MPFLRVGDLDEPGELARVLTTLRAIVAWPRDEARQARYIAVDANGSPGPGRQGPITTAEDLGWLAAGNGSSTDEARATSYDKLRALITAGATLRACHQLAEGSSSGIGGSISLRSALREVEHFGEPRAFLLTRFVEITAAWDEFRSVAHLGAALAERLLLNQSVEPDAVVIRGWLARAAAYEVIARGIQPLHGAGRESLVRGAEIWRIESSHLDPQAPRDAAIREANGRPIPDHAGEPMGDAPVQSKANR